MSRIPVDLQRMALEDTEIGLKSHYKPMENFIKERGYKTGIEIGTAYGGLANHLLSTCELDLLITIDPYKYYPDMPGLFDQEDYNNLNTQTQWRLIGFKQCHMIRLTSEEYFLYYSRVLEPKDFIFIDGLHKYETIKWECEHYQNLLKLGGALMGHDYNIFDDVNKAVDEFAGRKQLFTLPGNIWYINY